MPVAETFTFADENGESLSQYAQLDTLVTMVDTAHFTHYLASEETVQDTQEATDEEDTRTLVNLLTEQIEFANVIVMTKTDLVDTKTKDMIRGIINKLNPPAKVVESIHGDMDMTNVLNTGLFDFE